MCANCVVWPHFVICSPHFAPGIHVHARQAHRPRQLRQDDARARRPWRAAQRLDCAATSPFSLDHFSGVSQRHAAPRTRRDMCSTECPRLLAPQSARRACPYSHPPARIHTIRSCGLGRGRWGMRMPADGVQMGEYQACMHGWYQACMHGLLDAAGLLIDAWVRPCESDGVPNSEFHIFRHHTSGSRPLPP